LLRSDWSFLALSWDGLPILTVLLPDKAAASRCRFSHHEADFSTRSMVAPLRAKRTSVLVLRMPVPSRLYQSVRNAWTSGVLRREARRSVTCQNRTGASVTVITSWSFWSV
jgi:hypothetical protein